MNKQAKPSVILMDCECRPMEGVISSFGKRRVEVIALSSLKDNPPPAFKSKYVYHTYFSPDVRDEKAYLKFLDSLPHRGVLLFSTDWAAEFVAKYKQEIQEAGYLVNISDHQIFKRGFDKDSIYQVCIKCGVPTIKTKEVHAIEDVYSAAEELGFPLLLKPTRLAGSRFHKINNEQDIPLAYEVVTKLIHSEEFASQQSKMIIQEFINYNYNDLYCVEYYSFPERNEQEVLTIQKIRPDINYDGSVGSRIFVGQTIQSPELEGLSRRLLGFLNWTGLAHLDWLYSEKYNSYLLCEINPRLPGFSNLTTKIGFEMGWYYYAGLAGIAVHPFRFKRALYFEALRHPGDLTSNLLAVFNGHLSFWSFIKPYLKILTLRYDVVLDVFYKTDLRLTWENYKRDFRKLAAKLKKVFHV